MRDDVAALYVDAEGPYPSRVAEWWDAKRNAALYDGDLPVVAHPPCGPWGRLKALCTKQDPQCGIDAVAHLARVGGVLEHPAHSSLWRHLGLPAPGGLPFQGFWTLEVDQCRWGHLCRKRTWLLFKGVRHDGLPPIPPWREPTHCIDDGAARLAGRPSKWLKLPSHMTHITPPAFADWLIECASRVRLDAASRGVA